MRRKVGLFLLCGLVLPLVVAGSAFAQGATLRIDDQTPAPGQEVRLTGTGFSSASPVNIRFDSRSGAVRASGTALANGVLQPNPLPLVIPASLSPGWHLIFGTQTVETTGRPRAFTPGRVRINVGASAAGASAAPTPGGRGGLPGSPLGLLAVGSALILLATGATLTARRLRAHNRPQLSS